MSRPEIAPTTPAAPPQSDPPGPLFELEEVSIGFDRHVVLREISLSIAASGATGILGPAGVGKSTLIRTLARINDVLPSFWIRGSLKFNGVDYMTSVSSDEARKLAPLLAQKAALTTSTVVENAIAELPHPGALTAAEKRELARGVLEPLQLWQEYLPLLDESVLSLSIGQIRRLSVARLLACGAQCLFADEPLRDLGEREAAAMEQLLERVARRCALIMITHNQRAARRLCDRVCLITAGRLVESSSAEAFFSRPKTQLAAAFIRQGNCWPTGAELEAQGPAERLVPQDVERRRTPRSFHWVINRRLGGMQWPGLLGDERDELAALARLNCRHLVSLTELPFPAERLVGFDIRAHHFPIADMGVPTPEAMYHLCAQLSAWVDADEPAVVHCRAGLGRTGTVLACVLIHRGRPAVSAISEVRAIDNHYIQSEAQTRFVGDFELFLQRCDRDGPKPHARLT